MPDFSPAGETRLRALLDRHTDRRRAILPALALAQEEFGSLTPEVQALVAGRLDLPAAPVRDAAAFYSTMFRARPGLGRHWIRVCAALPCEIAGCGRILDALRETLGLSAGGTTPDGLFTLDETECLADCDRAPVLRVGDRLHRDLTPEGVRALVRDLRAHGP
jgi:NADH:ubiquinone oxidoreductase subunit E